MWDYFYKQNDPTLSLQIDDDGLFSVAMQAPDALTTYPPTYLATSTLLHGHAGT